jgi:hypothetical protein
MKSTHFEDTSLSKSKATRASSGSAKRVCFEFEASGEGRLIRADLRRGMTGRTFGFLLSHVKRKQGRAEARGRSTRRSRAYHVVAPEVFMAAVPLEPIILTAESKRINVPARFLFHLEAWAQMAPLGTGALEQVVPLLSHVPKL